MSGVTLLSPSLNALLVPLLFFVALAGTVGAWLAGPSLLATWRRARVQRQAFPKAWRNILRRRMPAFARLPPHLQLQIKKHVQVLVAEKPFIGCAGLVITDEMRVLISAQAALLLLNRNAGYFSNLRQVLVYPGAFVVDRPQTDEQGVVQEFAAHQGRVLSGESWQQGQVILSWQDVLDAAAAPDDGHNVVIHEFAHQLDQETGRANGAPFLFGHAARVRWASTLAAEYEALRQRVQQGQGGLLDAYGASAPAEFFAVASEVFFERPKALSEAHPALYRELTGCYRTDPLSW